MPEILRIGGFRFFFFSREGVEPRTCMSSKPDATLSSGWNRSRSPNRAVSEVRNSANYILSLRSTARSLFSLGMSTLASKPIANAVDVTCTADELVVTLADGRTVSAPLTWFPRLLGATRLNALSGALSAVEWEYTGTTWTKISQSEASSLHERHISLCIQREFAMHLRRVSSGDACNGTSPT